MIVPVLDSSNETEFYLVLGRRILRFLPILKSLKVCIKFIQIHTPGTREYPEVKSFIENIFDKFYHAKISVNYPQIMSVSGKNDKIISAVGIRSSKDSRLFLEQYLDKNIEEILSEIFEEKIDRSQVVEIGSLASNKRNGGRCLYVALAAYLKKYGYKYAVATGTDYLQRYFEKAGLKPRIIANADKSRLKNKEVNWGTYYETKPKVMVLSVDRGYNVLNRFLGITVIESITRLYPHRRYV